MFYFFQAIKDEAEPLSTDIQERCFEALEHIQNGLESVKYLQLKKDEMEAKHRKAQERHERDNPKMCRPMEPIPMPYKVQESDSNKVETYQETPKKDWHDNLKALLLRKAFLTYVTLSEYHFSRENYGKCVKMIKRGLNCYFSFLKISEKAKISNVKLLLSFAYGVAGDTFMILTEKWDEKFVKFMENFNEEGSEADEFISKAVEDLVEERFREWSLKVPKDLEEAVLLAVDCFKAARETFDSIEDQDVTESKDDLLGE